LLELVVFEVIDGGLIIHASPFGRPRRDRSWGRVPMAEHVYGRTKAGKPITDATIDGWADHADRGYVDGQLTGRKRGRGRPPLGDKAKSVGSVRLEPDLRDEVVARAKADGVTVSELVRRALRKYLRSA
jgi:hypothetical protein